MRAVPSASLTAVSLAPGQASVGFDRSCQRAASAVDWAVSGRSMLAGPGRSVLRSRHLASPCGRSDGLSTGSFLRRMVSAGAPSVSAVGQQRLEQARAAVESRLDSIFHGGWVPSDDDAIDDNTSIGAANGSGGQEANRGRWRIDPGRRAAAAMVAVVALTAAVVGWRVLADRPRAEALPESSSVRVSVPAGASASTASAARASGASRSDGSVASGTAPPAQIVVDVVGKVHRPGIVRLAPGSRVDDAVRAVGGALPHTNLTTLNLARVCADGEQIVVGLPGSGGAGTVVAGPVAGTASVGGAAASPGAATRINLNTATAEQLNTLPGVGPVMAQRILDWRTAHGSFASIDQLKQVSGIGDAMCIR